MWLTREPLPGDAWEPRTWHRYQYAYASPISYYDPYGLQVPPPVTPAPAPTPPPYTPVPRPTPTPGPSPTPTATPAPQPKPTPPQTPTATPTAPYRASSPRAARWVDECARLLGISVGETLLFPTIDIPLDIWLAKVRFQYEVEITAGGTERWVTVSPEALTIGPLEFTREGEMHVASLMSEFASESYRGQTKTEIGIYPPTITSIKGSFGLQTSYEWLGEDVALALDTTFRYEWETRPLRVALVPVVVYVFTLVPQAAPQLQRAIP